MPVAVRRRAGIGPTVVFLPGYASDMAGTKAMALDAWAERTGRAYVRFDYSGCGESAGDFEMATLAHWRDDALGVVDGIDGPVLLVGSSMGGWLMLLVALARRERVAALVGIAAAPDFTDWGFTEAERIRLHREGRLIDPSDHGEPLITTRAFWNSGQANLLLDRDIDIHVPVRLLHGQQDADVPWRQSLKLAERLRSDDVQVVLVKDGSHRLSRQADLALLVRTIESLS